jgi:hypothetical protein
MKRQIVFGVWLALACAFAACSLNPQPLPPFTPDDAAADVSTTLADSGKPFEDGAAAMPDATPDAMPDASTGAIDAADATTDGETDASDAESDAESDASEDADE